MRRILLIAIVALGIALPVHGQFDFRTTGSRSARVWEITCTPTAAPAVSANNMTKLFVPCSGIVGYSAGNTYISQDEGAWQLLSSFVGAGAVVSVFGRTGTVTAVAGDYGATLITFTPSGGIAATNVGTAITELDTEKSNLASPTFTGTPAAPTAAAGTNTTQLATTAHVFAERSNTATLTTKTIALGSNTVSGTTAQFNTALSDNDFATLAGSETLTNKTINLTSNTLATTSAQLATALTDETGSGGGFVRATSPTLSGPIFSTIVNTGTLTLPTSTDTLTGRATTDTLTNKSISLGSNTVTATSAQVATAVSDETGTGSLVLGTSPTIVTPTIASFTNAAHNHTNAAGGAQLTVAALSDHVPGTAVAYSGGNFTAATGSWTVESGDQFGFTYSRTGKEMLVSFNILTSTTSNSTLYVALAVPGGATIATSSASVGIGVDNGGSPEILTIVAQAGLTAIRVFRGVGGSNWSVSTNNLRVTGQIIFTIQ